MEGKGMENESKNTPPSIPAYAPACQFLYNYNLSTTVDVPCCLLNAFLPDFPCPVINRIEVVNFGTPKDTGLIR